MNGAHPLPTHRSNAFTLVELLVVIAVISVLAGLLLPALEDAMRASRLIVCMNQQKQQYLVLTTYMDENRDMLPPAGNCWGALSFLKDGYYQWNPRVKWSWGAYLCDRGYIQDMDLLVCPDTDGEGHSEREDIIFLKKSPEVWLNNDDGVWCNYSMRHGGRFSKKYPNRQLMLAEAAQNYSVHPPYFWEIQQHGITPAIKAGSSIISMPGHAINVTFSDGSVMTLQDWTSKDRWDWSNTTNYPSNERSGDGFWKSFNAELSN